MKKILITGASGFLGSRICDYYKDNYEIYAPTHSEMDITKEEVVSAMLKREKPDVVIHCAAVSDTGKCEQEPEYSWKINVDGSRNIAKASKEIGAKCILCSSDQVYFGSDIMDAHQEDEIVNPYNVYGREKLQAEKDCLMVNPDCVLLRLSWMYDTKNNQMQEHGDFMRTLLDKIAKHEELSYPIYDKRGITYVKEVVKNIEKTFALPGGVYNFGSPNEKNTYETVRNVFVQLQLQSFDIEKIKKNEQAFLENPRNLTMSQAKINQHGIAFTHTEEGILGNLKEIYR